MLYPYEWTPSMLRDAALMFLDLLQALEAAGYGLKDGHPWNIVFDGPRPVWVDLTSIVTKSEDAAFNARADFHSYFLRPLRMIAAGLGAYARLGLSQLFGPPVPWLDNVVALNFAHAFGQGRRAGFQYMFRSAKVMLQKKFQGMPLRPPIWNPVSIEDMRAAVLELNVRPQAGEWTNYYRGMNELPRFESGSSNVSEIAGATPKHRLIDTLFSELRPKTVLDIGCNAGLYSFMAAAHGARVVGLDLDESAVDEMYLSAKTKNLTITCGTGDFVAPIKPAEYLHKPRLRPLHARVQSEMVICLAIVHHWVFKRLQLRFEDVAQILSAVATRVLVVEFVPREDKHVATWPNVNVAWYNVENFAAALRLHFREVSVHQSFPSPRLLLVCKK